ncbi:hypothetical protein N7G274_006431 [Stereocaulon virgatum]|uniref:C2H2-type domain-containing protein n=1 Tax=Stereocaulon virgatum TaxID=373712 RepID=A0ABR4AC84_9LECA
MVTPRSITPCLGSGGSERMNHNTLVPTNTTMEGGQTFRPQVALQLPAGPPISTICDYVADREDSKMTKLVAGRSTLPTSTRHQRDVMQDSPHSLRTSMQVVDGSVVVTDTSSFPGLTNTTDSGAAESVSTSMGYRCLDQSNKYLELGQSGALETPPPPPPQAIILFCPFHFLGCHREYNGQREGQWLAHSLTHFEREHRRGRRLKVDPPSHNCCPFCDEKFWAPRGRSSWEKRMSHVKLHHQFGHRLSHSRPDFALIEYLWQSSLIDAGVYRELKPKQGLPTPPSSDDGDGAVTVLNQASRSERRRNSGPHTVEKTTDD